ncbi:MAG: hypothetical protein H3C28_15105 [Sphingomonadales bacterium]|nr:hypothetical protein [Sphingomonadales bacterium]
MKIIIPRSLKPKSLDLFVLEENPDFRSDFLFFIRLAGTYAQTIFWQAFPRSAMARRKKMYEIAKKTISEDKKPFREAILEPKKRYTKTTDIFHKGFIQLLRELEKDPDIKKTFSDGLKQEHGIFWNFNELIEALEVLREKRHYLEHYEERRRKKEIFDKRKNVFVMEALGILLLPELCNMLEMSAEAVKGKAAREVRKDIHTLFAWCKQERTNSIQRMFSIERKRSSLDKRRRKALAPDAQNTQVWLKSYRALCTSPTDYKQFQFKRRYDFIGPQNLRILFKELGAPLQHKSRSLVYESGVKPTLSFRYDVEPFYLLAVRIGATIHRFLDFAPKDRKGKLVDRSLIDIRNTLAHNGLFWDIHSNGNLTMKPEEVFNKILAFLSKGRRTEFCDRIEALLRRENHPIIHSTVDGHPKTEKIWRCNEEWRVSAKKTSDTAIKISHRRAVRKIAAKWMRALQQAGQANGLHKAGKNAI